MTRLSTLLFCAISLSACGSLRTRPSQAVHQRAERSHFSRSSRVMESRKGNDSVVARGPAALRGAPLAYELDQARFSWPLSTQRITSLFGERWGRPHEGLDIAAPQGTPVMAARGGKVIYAENQISGYGNMVIIRHSPSFATVYAHLSRIGVRVGDYVDRGKVIGKVGMTGRATKPHLHFEVRNSRAAVDPLLYLPGQYAFSRLKK